MGVDKAILAGVRRRWEIGKGGWKGRNGLWSRIMFNKQHMLAWHTSERARRLDSVRWFPPVVHAN